MSNTMPLPGARADRDPARLETDDLSKLHKASRLSSVHLASMQRMLKRISITSHDRLPFRDAIGAMRKTFVCPSGSLGRRPAHP